MRKKNQDWIRHYASELEYKPMQAEGNRHCYIHPNNVATHWELNKLDRSYKRPVCEGCAIIEGS